MADIYKLEHVGKSFSVNESSLEIFRDINLDIGEGQAVAIVGASGSGKSTLLHLMGALDKPSSGKILFDGQDLAAMGPAAQASFRNHKLGFVFQFHHLLPEFSALENVALPGLIAHAERGKSLARARELLVRVGLEHRLDSKPSTLSGGERQRAAIARALLLEPRVVLGDEPTGNLDETTGHEVGNLLLELNRELGTTLVIVTHNLDLASRMDRVLELRSGELYEKVLA